MNSHAYGYSDPYETVNPGQLVWLYDDSYNPLDNDLTVTWSQYDDLKSIDQHDLRGLSRLYRAIMEDYDYDYITLN